MLSAGFDTGHTIDVWWLTDEGGFAVLVPHLLHSTKQFQDHRLRVFTTGTADPHDDSANLVAEERTRRLAALLERLRFESEAVSLKLNLWRTRQSSLDAFNALAPGLLPPNLHGVDDDAAVHAPMGDTAVDIVQPPPAVAVQRRASLVLPARSGSLVLGPSDRPPAPPSIPAPTSDLTGVPPSTSSGMGAKPGAAEPAGIEAAGVTHEASAPVSPALDPLVAWRSWLRVDCADMDHDLRRLLVDETRRLVRCAELMRERSREATVVFVVLPVPLRGQPVGLLSAWMELLSRDMPPTVFIRGNGSSVVTASS
jgi:hypothetical protein